MYIYLRLFPFGYSPQATAHKLEENNFAFFSEQGLNYLNFTLLTFFLLRLSV